MFATQDQDNRRAGARGLTRNPGAGARRLRRAAAGAVCAAAVALPVAGAAMAQAATSAPHTLASGWTSLALQNGWTNYGSGTAAPAVTNISGIVHLEGAMHGGANPDAFTLPAGFRPTHNVWVSVDMDLANRGHILISSNGQVAVFAEGNITGNATAFTSLDGVSFAP
jgi:hypothetical protein